MKIFVVTTTADITPGDIQYYIWKNIEKGYVLSVAELSGVDDIIKEGREAISELRK